MVPHNYSTVSNQETDSGILCVYIVLSFCHTSRCITTAEIKTQTKPITAKISFVPLYCHTHSPSFMSVTPGNHQSFLYLFYFVILTMLDKWNHTFFDFLRLIFFIWLTALETHPSCCVYQQFMLFSCWVVFCVRGGPQLVSPFTCWKSFGYVQFWVTTNEATKNTHIEVSVCTYIFILC